METVALEWIGSMEVEAQDVVQFVQQLNNVPEDAVCEVGDIFSRWWRTSGRRHGNQDERRIRNEVHLTCEPRVAEFLCKKFGNQTRYVTGSEVILIRCKRVFPGSQPLGKKSCTKYGVNLHIQGKEKVDEGHEETTEVEPNMKLMEAPTLPIEKVIALIDLLGDQVVDAQEAYELFADRDARTPQRMTMLGLTKALEKLCKNQWTAKPAKRHTTTGEGTSKITVDSLRYLLSKLISSDNIAVKRIPTTTTAPFLSYTDFLACYVAFLATQHSLA